MADYHESDAWSLIRNRPDNTTITRAAAIKAYCFDCTGGQREQLVSCPFPDCPFNPFRRGRAPKGTGSRAKAIRAFCKECQGGSRQGVAECPTADCPAYHYRRGRDERPGRRKRCNMSAARKAASKTQPIRAPHLGAAA